MSGKEISVLEKATGKRSLQVCVEAEEREEVWGEEKMARKREERRLGIVLRLQDCKDCREGQSKNRETRDGTTTFLKKEGSFFLKMPGRAECREIEGLSKSHQDLRLSHDDRIEEEKEGRHSKKNTCQAKDSRVHGHL